MNILVVTQYFFPEQFRINEICRELVKRGNNVTILTGLPNYPEGKIYPGYEEAFTKVDNYYGAKVYRCKLRPRGKGAMSLALNYLSFVYQANKTLRNIGNDFDVIYTYGLSPITSALPAIKMKCKSNAPLAFYCLDIWPESVRDANNGRKMMSKKNPIFLIAKILSIYIYRNTDWIGTKCQEFIDYLNNECNVPKRKMTVLMEHAEEDYLQVMDKPINNGVLDIMFLGNLGKAQNCDQMIEALSRIEDKSKIMLHFVGDGSEKTNLENKVKKMKLSSVVKFHGYHPLSEIVDYYNMADVCILGLSNTTSTGVTPPGKLFGYMASGRCIIGAIQGAGARLIKEADCGICVPPDDVDALASSIEWASNNMDILIEKGKNGRKYFKNNLTLDKHVDCLEYQLNKLVNKVKK